MSILKVTLSLEHLYRRPFVPDTSEFKDYIFLNFCCIVILYILLVNIESGIFILFDSYSVNMFFIITFLSVP